MPYLNIDDGMDEHPKIEGLSDAAFRQFVRDACAWARSGNTSSSLVHEMLAEKRLRRAPRHWLPERLVGPLPRYRRKIPREIREAVYRRDGHSCLHCGTRDRLTLDHIVPWSAGGSDEQDNLQTLCQSCNSRKGARV